jgi:hypothetical protein
MDLPHCVSPAPRGSDAPLQDRLPAVYSAHPTVSRRRSIAVTTALVGLAQSTLVSWLYKSRSTFIYGLVVGSCCRALLSAAAQGAQSPLRALARPAHGPARRRAGRAAARGA